MADKSNKSSTATNTSKPTLNGKPLSDKGVAYRVEGQKLILEVDVSNHFGPSSTGKNLIVASTSGNKQLEINGMDVFIGVNMYRGNPDFKK